MKQRYLLSLTAAVAASAGYFSGDLLTAQAAPMEYRSGVSVEISGADAAQLENFYAAKMCDAIEAKFALPEGTCTGTKIRNRAEQICSEYNKDSGKWDLDARIRVPGNFVPSP